MSSIKQEIESLPLDLPNLYSTLLEDFAVHTTRLFQWLCFGIRPMNPWELRQALAIDNNGSSDSLDICENEFPYGSSQNDVISMIGELSKGLAEVTMGDVNSPSYFRVHLIHQSVYDFLVQSGFKKLPYSSLADGNALPHMHLFRVCVKCLHSEEIQRHFITSDTSTSELTHHFDFLRYAIVHWISHARLVDGNQLIHGLISACLDPHPRGYDETCQMFPEFPFWLDNRQSAHACLNCWLEFVFCLKEDHYRDVMDPVYSGIQIRYIENPTILHILVFQGLPQTFGALVQRMGFVDPTDENGHTPLLLAAKEGLFEEMEHLLKRDEVDVNCRYAKLDDAPLHYAVSLGRIDILKLLLGGENYRR